jgi:hypothetical protein
MDGYVLKIHTPDTPEYREDEVPCSCSPENTPINECIGEMEGCERLGSFSLQTLLTIRASPLVSGEDYMFKKDRLTTEIALQRLYILFSGDEFQRMVDRALCERCWDGIIPCMVDDVAPLPEPGVVRPPKTLVAPSPEPGVVRPPKTLYEELLSRENEVLNQQFDYICDRVVNFLRPVYYVSRISTFDVAFNWSLFAPLGTPSYEFVESFISRKRFCYTLVGNFLIKKVKYDTYFMDENSEEYRKFYHQIELRRQRYEDQYEVDKTSLADLLH